MRLASDYDSDNSGFRRGVHVVNPVIDEGMFMEAQGGSTPPRTWFPLVFLLCFLLIALLAAGYIFRDTITAYAQKLASDARTKNVALQDEMRTLALYQDIETQLELLQEEMNKLLLMAQAFNAQVEAIIGLPFEVAHINSTRRLNHAILKSDTFAETWTQLLNARVTTEMLENKKCILTQLQHRMNRETISPLDKQHLDDLHQWIQQAHHQLEQNQSTITRLGDLFRELHL